MDCGYFIKTEVSQISTKIYTPKLIHQLPHFFPNFCDFSKFACKEYKTLLIPVEYLGSLLKRSDGDKMPQLINLCVLTSNYQ
jgi:hypothetical protein